MSQIALAIAMNVSQKTISAYENGKNEPSISLLKHFADYFDTSIDYLVGYSDIRKPIDRIAQQNLTEDECDLLNSYRELSKKEQNVALGILIGIQHSK